MKTVEFYARSNRSGNLLHVETDGCIVNIRVGLTDSEGRKVTSVQIVPEDETRGGDSEGRVWRLADDGRVIRQPKYTNVPDPETRYGLTDDTTLCPHCQWRTEFEDTGEPDGEQLHTCLNPECRYTFLGFFDPEDFDTDGNFIG